MRGARSRQPVGGEGVIDMAEYIFLMHDDALVDEKAWDS
jgi:hypothetical protein